MRPIYAPNPSCELCSSDGGELVWQNDNLRVIMVDDPHFAGFVRVVWQAHVSEMTDLQPAQRSQLMQTVCLVETVMRQVLQPTKINLASLGNMTPHLHWHVIPRFANDINFPTPIWALTKEQAAQTARPCVSPEQRDALVTALRIALWA
ncbi:HIT family protein [Hydromonas duriensis]|uniref:Diadenosine tetraphosphate (Ap4A) HIT family hydrolase n=1 Tax=Hydromonas duriensis TaxID=1527608 RepID=A0A4R6YAS4_9BURK|nr:HIT family protein [Hydromonas duriensis]TDR32591.1 diadenosine tetraphosphate (Ap4A) HIT family hydrolase [Hydromonas duriensis]